MAVRRRRAVAADTLGASFERVGRRFYLLLTIGLLLAACGGSDSVTTTTGSQAVTTAGSQDTVPEVTTTSVTGVEAPELGGTSWNVTDYRLPDGSITNVWKTEVTIAFADDGTVSGSAGCNDYQGTWLVSGNWDEFEDGVPDPNDGQVLTLDGLSWTEMACEDDAIMEQETEILDLLQTAGRWVLIRGEFNLRDADGGFLFKAESA